MRALREGVHRRPRVALVAEALAQVRARRRHAALAEQRLVGEDLGVCKGVAFSYSALHTISRVHKGVLYCNM